MAALTASIGEMLGTHSRTPIAETNRVNHDDLARRLENERRRRIAEIDAEVQRQAEALRQRKAAKARRKALNRRNELVAKLHSLVTFRSRKDGSRYMVAKPGYKADVKWLRFELTVVAMDCRPANGYPAPPPRRTELYPKGGAWKHRPGNPLAQLQGEYSRLSQYVRTLCDHDDQMVDKGEPSVMYNDDGEPRRALRNMLAHCARLERKIDLLFKVKTTCLNCGNETKNGKTYCSMACRGNATSETNIRRRPGTKYYRAVVDAR